MRGARGAAAVALAGMAAMGTAAAVEGLLIEPGRVVISRQTIAIAGLPAALAGWTIAHLSDLHVEAQHWRPGLLGRAIELANSQHPDLIAITGDFVDSNAGTVVMAEYLRQLRAPAGVVAVLGNHDHYGNRRRPRLVVRALEESGARVLLNSSCAIEAHGETIWVAGVDDGRTRHADLGRALAEVPAEARPRILLSHFPDVVDSVRPGQVDLVLSGHTHGGQINLPIIRGMALRRNAHSRYIGGRYDVGGTALVISRGIASIGIPVRFRCPPEVVLITLVPATS